MKTSLFHFRTQALKLIFLQNRTMSLSEPTESQLKANERNAKTFLKKQEKHRNKMRNRRFLPAMKSKRNKNLLVCWQCSREGSKNTNGCKKPTSGETVEKKVKP